MGNSILGTMRFALLLFAFCLAASSPATAAETRNVLVLFSNNRLLPANVEVDRGLREGIGNTPGRRVEFFEEFLDRPTFSGPAFDQTVRAYCGRNTPPGRRRPSSPRASPRSNSCGDTATGCFRRCR